VSITAANQKTVANTATDSDIRNFGSAGTDQAVGVTPTSRAQRRVNFLQHVQSNLLQAKLQGTASAASPAGAVPTSGTQQCVDGDPTSGTVNVNYIDNGDNEVSSGDAVTITYNKCLDPIAAERLNGTISFSITKVTGTPSASAPGWSITVSVVLSNFSVTPTAAGSSATTANGGFTLTFSQDKVNQTTSIVVGANLSVRDASGTVTWTNFSFTFVENDLTGSYQENGSGTVSSSALGGTVNIKITNLSGFDPDFPSSGSIKITGDKSSLTLTPLNNVTVRLELDLADNGSIDATEDVAWALLA
jgi:hypothetical protein